jgi:hypothetical protein
MNKTAIPFKQTRAAEAALGDAWLRVGERQSADQEWIYQARHFHQQCLDHIERLAEFAPKYGTDVDLKQDGDRIHGLLGKTRHKISELVGRRPESGLLLMRDQRMLFTLAYATSFHWIVMGQVAQACRDADLLTMVSQCHKQTLTQVKWLKSEIKVASPQVFCA